MSSYIPAAHVEEVNRLQRRALIVGVAVSLVCLIGAFINPEQFFSAYLTAYLFYLGLALGSFAIFMIYCITGGAWGFLIQRILEAGMRTLPYVAVLFIPIFFGLRHLYIWARPEEVATYADLQHKQVYLNVPFFCVRAVLFFLIWNVIIYLLSRWSGQQDAARGQRLGIWQANLSGPGLVILGITITFAAVDWVMSLQPKFHSTIFGPLLMAGQVVSAQALAMIAVAWLAPRGPAADVLSREVVGDLGNLLFTFLILFTYMAWFQFMLIWIANLPQEVIWLNPRSSGFWLVVTWALLVFHFIVPFFLLLMRDVKQNLQRLARVAALILVMQFVWVCYLIIPVFPGTSAIEHWMDILMPFGLGGLWLASFLHELKRRPLLPSRPADRAEAFHLRGMDEEAALRPQEVENG